MTERNMKHLPVLALFCLLCLFSPAVVHCQENSSGEHQATPQKETSIGGALAKESREAAGEEEENANLKHASAVRYLAAKTGMTVHQAHLLANTLNFVIIAFLIYWFARKGVPQLIQKRNETIQRAVEEARAASSDASRRLSDIESRLLKLDQEIGALQAAAEKEAEAEEVRIRQASEDDIRKVVHSAEQEIQAAAKQARRELAVYTADLAVALAQKQIHVDSDTDQALVSNFAGQLSSPEGGKAGK